MVRFKNRWLLVELIPAPGNVVSLNQELGKIHASINGKDIWNALKQSVILNFGDTGWGEVGYSLTVKYFSPTTNLCIIRVGREHIRTAWGAVTLLSTIEGQKILPNVVHVSGTIKQAQLAAIEHNRVTVARYSATALVIGARPENYDNFLNESTQEIQALQG